MSIFKCKMCGGTIEFEQGASVGVCDSCGTKQTLPRLDDDRRANLYDRANHFRRNNEFDKAAGIYEQILTEDTADAEAYWSLVLCRYGIEYVEDPATRKRVPTVNRAQFTSIFDDDNYKSALQYADGYQRELYEKEASTINEIQKGILAISQKEEPFDVFICYKETDNNGRRTQDSVLANDLYHQLTQEGFKVFFSRITLEDKLGTAYEPYIFAALNSAKVMVVLGTRPEYFNAVWVKNEWSRYLSIVKQSGGKKVLIPAYRDMDPYDLPDEFSHLQAQDMSKLGFMQDLIRGVMKIVSADEPKSAVKEAVVVSGNTNIAPLLKRAFMFLEDGEWDKADDFCEQVLNQDPENAQAYIGKLMAELHVHKQEDLANCEKPLDNNNNYQKAVRFGDEKTKKSLSDYRFMGIYNKAVNTMKSASSESAFHSAAETFKTISGFKDADALAAQCLDKAEDCRKDVIYSSAKSIMSKDTIEDYEIAIKKFRTISGWKDADEQICTCQCKIEEIKDKEEADRLERDRQAEEWRIITEKAAKKRRKVIAIISSAIAACIVFSVLLITIIIPNIKYNVAIDLYNAGKYDEAISEFTALSGFKDSTDQIIKCKYNAALDLYNSGKYNEAMAVFISLNGYKDSSEQVNKCKDSIINVASVGDIVYFGSYEQDNNTTNGKEDIEWIVLSKEGNKVLLISKYALDCQKYNTSWSNITWGTCSLRKWLNGTFIASAFSSKEQNRILSSTVTADMNPEYNIYPGKNTTDKVFLLSISEVNKYFNSDEQRKCTPTRYTETHGANIYEKDSIDGKATCWWWLRSPGNESSCAANVNSDGSIFYFGMRAHVETGTVRPAMWIDLSSIS